ncbi:MAG TPA: aminotransferase class V-fold PLP-dependent enzyme [Pseudonocardia sp.]
MHFNSAGAALPPSPVTDAVIAHLLLEARMGGYEAAAAAEAEVEGAYDALARLLNCGTDEVAVFDSATRAWDMAFYGVAFRPGDRIFTCRAEYASNAIAFLQVAARYGAIIEVVEDDEHGQLSVADLERRLDRAGDAAKLIAVTHVPTNGGLVNPVEQVGVLARAAGVTYLLDACQSAGQLPLDTERIGCDLLSGTGRKFLRAPRGTGFLYVRRSVLERLEPPMLDLRSATWTGPDTYEIKPDARRFETWECNHAAKIGLRVAVEYALGWGLDGIAARISGLADELRVRLDAEPGVQVRDKGLRRSGIVTFTVDGLAATDVARALSAKGVHVHVSHATSAQYDMAVRGLDQVVRASVHYYNTEVELDHLISALPAR